MIKFLLYHVFCFRFLYFFFFPANNHVLVDVRLFCMCRFQLNSKKNKVDECTMKPGKYSSQEVSIHLSNALNNEDVIEENNPFPLSNSLIGGSLNTCKSRTIDFMLTERLLQGSFAFSFIELLCK